MTTEKEVRSDDRQRTTHDDPIYAPGLGWTIPVGFKHPCCPACGYEHVKEKPRKSVGGASVLGQFCRKCFDDMGK